MFTLKITHNGKEYSSIQQGMEAAMAAGMEKVVRQKLAHLKPELDREGAVITIDVKNGKVTITHVSDELKEKIMMALK